MKFIDSIDVYVSSGKGGDGCLSYSRRKFVSKGLPDGGNGGSGGNVYILGCKNVNTLYHLKFKLKYKAEDGYRGLPNRKTGRKGKDLILSVPLGTIIYDNETKDILGEIVCDKQMLLVVQGGILGYGNFILNKAKSFSWNSFTYGKKSVLKFLHLEMRLLANVGLLGAPNVGKSSFLTSISNVYTKVGDYEFTTLYPILGIMKKFNETNIIIADIPGIKRNSCIGGGLGISFLRHLLKTQLLLHFIDISNITNIDCFAQDLFIMNKELENFDISFCKKDKWVIFNKIDLISGILPYNDYINLAKKYNYSNIFFISCKSTLGLNKLCFNLMNYIYK